MCVSVALNWVKGVCSAGSGFRIWNGFEICRVFWNVPGDCIWLNFILANVVSPSWQSRIWSSLIQTSFQQNLANFLQKSFQICGEKNLVLCQKDFSSLSGSFKRDFFLSENFYYFFGLLMASYVFISFIFLKDCGQFFFFWCSKKGFSNDPSFGRDKKILWPLSSRRKKNRDVIFAAETRIWALQTKIAQAILERLSFQKYTWV